MIRLLVTVAVVSLGALSCAEPPSEAELERMCAHLKELRGAKEPTDVKACVAEAKREGVSRRQARCRISAVNKTEYWVRCRTGEARIRSDGR